MKRSNSVVITALVLLGVLGLPQELAVAESRAVSITSPTDGATVQGLVEVTADASEVSRVEFSVSIDGGNWLLLGVDSTADDGWSAVWGTHGYDGSALLRAVGDDGSESVSDSVVIYVDNTRPVVTVTTSDKAFSPNHDGRKDSVVLKARSDETTFLRLELIDGDGRVLRTWSSAGPTTSLIVRWGGHLRGRRVRDGGYSIRGEAVDAVGSTDTDSSRVKVDTRPPRIRWIRIRPKTFRDPGRLRVTYRLRDRSPRYRVSLRVADRGGSVLTRHRRSDASAGFRYPTRYPSGVVLYPGLYSVRIRVVDDAGNVSRSRAKVFRMLPPVKGRVFTRIDDAGPRVALTFDDCNYENAWRRILRTLRRYRAKATFFCSGAQILGDRELALATVRQGHAIGSHGWDHALLSGRGATDVAWRIRRDERFWWNTTGDTTAPFYRPAYGGYTRATVAGAGSTGHGRVVMWDVDSLDYLTGSPSVITGRVLREAKPGSIILLHVLNQTADALPALLRGLSRRQLIATDLPDLFRRGGYR